MLDGSDWEYRTANTLHVTDDLFERFHAKVKQKLDRHLNEYEGKFTVDHGTYSVSSQHEQNHEDNQRQMMKSNEELSKLFQMCDRGWYHTSEHFTRYLDLADGGTNMGTAKGTNDNC